MRIVGLLKLEDMDAAITLNHFIEDGQSRGIALSVSDGEGVKQFSFVTEHEAVAFAKRLLEAAERHADGWSV